MSQEQQHGVIKGTVEFRVGDGAMEPVPVGPVEIHLEIDSAVLGWTEDDGSAGSAAIPLADYERYVKEGKIRVKDAA